MPTCLSCDAAIVFVPSATSDKRLILDAQPKKGVVRVLVHDDLTLAASMMPDEDCVARVVDVYTDHHATCPSAAEWKGKHR